MYRPLTYIPFEPRNFFQHILSFGIIDYYSLAKTRNDIIKKVKPKKLNIKKYVG